MAEVVRIVQGSDKTITVDHQESALVSATEIEIVVDSVPQIKKTLTGGGIYGVTASQFTVEFSADDSDHIASGEFNWEARYTAGGKKRSGRLVPSRVRIIDSAFENTA